MVALVPLRIDECPTSLYVIERGSRVRSFCDCDSTRAVQSSGAGDTPLTNEVGGSSASDVTRKWTRTATLKEHHCRFPNKYANREEKVLQLAHERSWKGLVVIVADVIWV
jgi:hypothetical protein